jgi:hypothetical protein
LLCCAFVRNAGACCFVFASFVCVSLFRRAEKKNIVLNAACGILSP